MRGSGPSRAGAVLRPGRGDAVTQTLGRWLTRIEAALLYVGVLATFGMMCLTSADALSRYLFNSPILGALEITEKYLMVAAIFLGLSYAYRGGLFIRVTFLVDRLSGKARLAADYFALPGVRWRSACSCCSRPAMQAIRGLRDDTELSTLPILVGPAYCFVPIGFLALTVMLLIDLSRVRAGAVAAVYTRGADRHPERGAGCGPDRHDRRAADAGAAGVPADRRADRGGAGRLRHVRHLARSPATSPRCSTSSASCRSARSPTMR